MGPASGVALSTNAVCRSRSSRTSRWKLDRMASAPRRLDSASRPATNLARPSSSPPSTRQARKRCRAARAIRLLPFIVRLPFLDRQPAGRLFGQAQVILGRQDLAGDRRGGLHHQPADLLLELAEHARVIAPRRLARARQDLLGRLRRLARLVGADARRRLARLLDQPLALVAGLAQDVEPLRFDARELRLDLLGVGQAGGNLLAPGLEHLEDRPVGQAVEHDADDAEADALREQVNPVHAERAGDLFDLRHGYFTRNSA